MGNLCAIFKIFSIEYFLYLILAIAVIVPLVFVFKNFNKNAQKTTKIVLVAIMSFFMILEYIGRVISAEKFVFFEQLPLNMFQIFVFISIFTLITNKSSWIKFGYFIIIPLSILGLFIYPNYYLTGSTFSLALIGYVFTNITLILFSILNLIWEDLYLEKKDIINVSVNFLIIICICHLVNIFLRFAEWGVHANYLATMGEEYDAVITWLYNLIPVPLVCLLPIFAIIIGIEFLMILPFDILKGKKERQSQMDELIALGNFKAQQESLKNSKKSSSQVLVRSETKAKPSEPKKVVDHSKKDGFININKVVDTNKKDEE